LTLDLGCEAKADAVVAGAEVVLEGRDVGAQEAFGVPPGEELGLPRLAPVLDPAADRQQLVLGLAFAPRRR
jgi:hypothetical protein